MNVTLKGHDILADKIKRMSNPKQLLDPDFRAAAVQSASRLTRNTPRKTGTTARGWTTPKKLGDSEYEVDNKVKSGKYSIAIILDSGRVTVRPKNSKRLYIPLSERGRAKKSGAKIPKDFVWGEDYVLANSARAYPGTGYRKNEIEEASRDLTRRVIARIRSVHGG